MANQLEDYSKAYVPQIKEMAQQAAVYQGDADKFFRSRILAPVGLSGGFAGQAFYAINRTIIDFSLKTVGIDANLDDLWSIADGNQLAQLDRVSFAGLGGFVKTGFISYMTPIYWIVLPLLFRYF